MLLTEHQLDTIAAAGRCTIGQVIITGIRTPRRPEERSMALYGNAISNPNGKSLIAAIPIMIQNVSGAGEQADQIALRTNGTLNERLMSFRADEIQLPNGDYVCEVTTANNNGQATPEGELR
jgi:hypothetical protein